MRSAGGGFIHRSKPPIAVSSTSQYLPPGAAASITSFLAVEVASPADTRDMGDAPDTSRGETGNCDRSDDLGKDGILVSERYEVSNDPADEPDPGYCNIIHRLSPLLPLA